MEHPANQSRLDEMPQNWYHNSMITVENPTETMTVPELMSMMSPEDTVSLQEESEQTVYRLPLISREGLRKKHKSHRHSDRMRKNSR